MIIFILLLLIILLITNNQLVLTGASYGLMLWYENIIPLLLPFMLISSIMENSIINTYRKANRKNYLAIPSAITLGIFCGYPIGAKTTAFFVKSGILSSTIGNIILPLCNNVSPMFFLGFIISRTLKNNISPILAYVVIYLPYLLTLILELLLYPKNHSHTKSNYFNNPSYIDKRNICEESINQITMVGLYIMLCSIISEFILSITWLNPYVSLYLVGITEITRGVTYINQSNLLDEQIKTALILACTSFGGISSVMQTAKVIQGSGLSLFHYIAVKIVCAISTFYLYILLI